MDAGFKEEIEVKMAKNFLYKDLEDLRKIDRSLDWMLCSPRRSSKTYRRIWCVFIRGSVRNRRGVMGEGSTPKEARKDAIKNYLKLVKTKPRMIKLGKKK